VHCVSLLNKIFAVRCKVVPSSEFFAQRIHRTDLTALLRLGQIPDDGDAMITVYEENRETIRASIRRWSGGRKYRDFR
jgi:hypothetical protein